MFPRCHRVLLLARCVVPGRRACTVRFRCSKSTAASQRLSIADDDIEAQARKWALLPHVHHRLQAFGIPHVDLPELLASFLGDGLLPCTTFDSPSPDLDQHLTRLFFAWAASSSTQTRLSSHGSVPPHTLAAIARLHRAADLSFPAEHFPLARALRRRVVMHVGPTNSGKTYGALRALAAAPSGLYAGPLRLLAHEIWERLNRGQIVPRGAAPDAGAEPDTVDKSGVDRPTLGRHGTGKYARECNLRTGEEFRVVSDHAALLSCTVEMAPLDTLLDVAVVDEIQMIADPARGSAWTMAVLGLAARELHLCGEEAALPVIRQIVDHTGDELVVHRYERLTPLVVQEHSLHGDLARIQKGDCLVTFSRSSIFALKQRIEKCTGLLCAVAYGRLPPEIRSEQAALFNDPHSGYDVIVASDAIGMGLNLKIKRIVFETLHKFDGYIDRPLSVSQVKQIAGRAGRFGLHGEPGGFVTTLHPESLPLLRAALAAPPQTLAHAVIDPSESWMQDVARLLPSHASIKALFEVPAYVARVRPPFCAALPSRLDEMARFLDTRARGMLLADKLLLRHCPTSWREQGALDVLARITALYRQDVRVGLDAVLAAAPLMQTLDAVEARMRASAPEAPDELSGALRVLEDMHKTLVLYLWLGLRHHVAFYDADAAHALKARVEAALDWALRRVSGPHRARAEARTEETGVVYRQKRRLLDGRRDDEVRVGVAAAEAVAEARRAYKRNG